MNFRTFLENQRSVISYDFDGVLHTSMVKGTTHPLDYRDWQSWQPYEAMHQQLKRDATRADIIVVSSRSPWDIPVMKKFIQAYNLPVIDVICTNMEPKVDVLESWGAIKHYDDNPEIGLELRGTDIEFVLVKHTS